MTGDSSEAGEFDLIASVFAPLTGGDKRALGLLDDAAILPQADGRDTVVSTDTMISDIHFLPHESADVVARRLLRVNLSDIASMGALPVGYFLNLSLTTEVDVDWIRSFADGLHEDQRIFGLVLLGGDTTRGAASLTLTATLLGEVASGKAVTRKGACPGDEIYLSGTVGDAALGLARFMRGFCCEDPTVVRFQRPEPRVSLGAALIGEVTAMADVSDGLAADLGHICRASCVSAEILGDSLPISESVKAALDSEEITLAEIVSGGDDYELVFTAPPGSARRISHFAGLTGIPVTRIGSVTKHASGIRLLDRQGVEIPLSRAGFQHF